MKNLLKLQQNFIILLLFFTTALNAQTGNSLLIEAESFDSKGGWKVDQQFVHEMGSPYLLAHGKGTPVEAAATVVELPATGNYKLWVRTKDWVPEHESFPGLFKIKLNENFIEQEFGKNTGWNWVDAGEFEFSSTSLNIEIHDLSGFDGRIDALFFTQDTDFTPPNDIQENIEPANAWRKSLTGLPLTPPTAGEFDVVVVGGGIAGTAAAIAAARGGCTVALIQDRPRLGGNASDEIRVHTLGLKGNKIVEEIDYAGASGTQIAVERTDNRHSVVEAEANISLFLSTRAYATNMEGSRILSIDAKHIETGVENRFFANQFIDCTGDGWLGYWSGARTMMGREAKSEFNESIAPDTSDMMMMGSTIWWNSKEGAEKHIFPEVPWAMDVAKDYSSLDGDWYWEYGVGNDPFEELEHIRDHLFRAIYGSFYNAKQKSGNDNYQLNFMAYIMGKRESRRIVGDYILTEDDIINAVPFEDGVAFEQRAIDLHLPKSDAYDFLTKAYFWKVPLYFIPFRSLYAADVDNLMMAGRCLSATHVGLGSPRVMNTGGQMGVATGYAASLCKKYNTNPRGIYQNHIKELKDSLEIRTYEEPENIVLTLDNLDAQNVEVEGDWQSSIYSSGFFGEDYYHDKNDGKGEKWLRFFPEINEEGDYRFYCIYTAGGNRANNVSYRIENGLQDTTVIIDQQKYNGLWIELGNFHVDPADRLSITIENANSNGYVIADAILISKLENVTSSGAELSDLDLSKIENIYSKNRISFIQCKIAENEQFSLEIYSISGVLLDVIAAGNYSSGKHNFAWKSNNAGIYIASLRSKTGLSSNKFVVTD